MKTLIVLTFDVSEPEEVPGILKQLDPESIAGFKHEARIVVDPYASVVERFLDE
jgi:hypothetical protein